MEAPELQLMIVTHGPDGPARIASLPHPRMEGVEYLVSWQLPEGVKPEIPAEIEARDDFRVKVIHSRGVARNRNSALDMLTAPVGLLSDDDLTYTEEDLRTVMRAFREHPEADIITFKYRSADYPRRYPDKSFPLSKPAKGYYATNVEMAFRRDSVKGKVRFNEYFGVAGEFPAGEEDIFLYDMLRAGLDGLFIPEFITRHDHASTSAKEGAKLGYIRTKGAVFLHIKPVSWPLRMIVHALREAPAKGLRKRDYIKAWLRGVRDARRLGVFGKK